MKKFYSIAMLLMLVASVSFFTSCGKDDNEKISITKDYAGDLNVYARDPHDGTPMLDTEFLTQQGRNFSLTVTDNTFGLSIDNVSIATIPDLADPFSISISGLPCTPDPSNANLCIVDYTGSQSINFGEYSADVVRVYGSFDKASNYMNLVVWANGSPELTNMPVYIEVNCQ